MKNEYVFSLITKFLMVAIGLIESVLLARYLGADLRGELSYVYSMASTLYLFLTFGIYTYYPFKRKMGKNIQKLMNEYMTLIIVLYFAYFVVFGSAFIFLLQINRTVSYILMLLPIMGYDKVVSFVFMIENPNKMNATSIVSTGIQCVYLIVLMLIAPKNLLAGLLYYIIGCFVRSIYFTRNLEFDFDISNFSFNVLFDYVKFGFFPMLALLLTTLNYRLDVIMLKQFTSISLADIGIYSIGVGLSEKALLIPDAIKEVLLSKLAKGKGASEVARVMRICFLASVVTALGINLVAGLLIKYLYGPEFRGAEVVTYISVWGTTVMVFFKMISQYNVVEHKQQMNVLFLLVSIFINFLMNVLMIPMFGINGAAFATIIGYSVSAIIFLIYFHFVSGIPIREMVVIQKKDILAFRDIINTTIHRR